MTSTSTRPSNWKGLARATRRFLVLACYGGYALMCAAWSALPQPWRWLVVIPTGLAAIVAMGMLLMPTLLGLPDGSDEMLDERQREARNRGYLNAYRVFAASALLIAIYLYIAADSGKFWLPRTANELSAAFWGFWLFAATLPAALIAWTEPDPLED